MLKKKGHHKANQQSNPTFAVRLPRDLAAGIEDLAERNSLPRGEIIRELIRLSIGQPDVLQAHLEGYNAGRRLGTRLIHLAITKAVRALPHTPEGAAVLLAQLEEINRSQTDELED